MKCCRYPFERVVVDIDGIVYFCNPDYNHRYVVGSLYEESFENIWCGKKAQEFRKSILDGSYKNCDLKICSDYKESDFCEFTEKDIENPRYPRTVDLNYLRSCDVRCMTCRDKLEMENGVKTRAYNNIIEDVVDMCKNAKKVYLNGNGEIFSSNHLKLLTNTLVKNYPDLNFVIRTNGLLCDDKHIKDFGLWDNIDEIFISVPAATKKTYEKIVRGGYWKKLQKNLKYLSDLKKNQGKFGLTLVFLYHSLNYKEMPAFVEMANKLGIMVTFCKFRDWGDSSDMCKEYKRYICWDPEHKDYKKFLGVLRKLRKMHGYKFEDPSVFNLKKEKKSLLKTIKNKIFGEKK